MTTLTMSLPDVPVTLPDGLSRQTVQEFSPFKAGASSINPGAILTDRIVELALEN